MTTNKTAAVKQATKEIRTERYDVNNYTIETYIPEHDDYVSSAPMSWNRAQEELGYRRLRRCLELMGYDPELADKMPGRGKLQQRLNIITEGVEE